MLHNEPQDKQILCIVLSTPDSHLGLEVRRAKLHSLAEACLRLGPRVALRVDDAIFVAVRGGARSIEIARVLARRLGWVSGVRFALGASAERALTAARYGSMPIAQMPIPSAGDWLNPFAVWSDPSEHADHARWLGRFIGSCECLGIRTMGAFLGLSSEERVQRFGQLGARLRRRVLGMSEAQWPQFAVSERWSESEDCSEWGCVNAESLSFGLKAALDRLMARLHGRGVRLLALETALLQRNGRRVEWKLEFESAQSSPRVVLDRVRTKLLTELDRHSPGSVLGVQLDAVAPTPAHTQSVVTQA